MPPPIPEYASRGIFAFTITRPDGAIVSEFVGEPSSAHKRCLSRSGKKIQMAEKQGLGRKRRERDEINANWHRHVEQVAISEVDETKVKHL